MTPTGDYLDEMFTLHQIDDATAEALLTGRPVPDDLQPLAEVVHAYRELASRSARPSAELAHQMAVGVFTEPVESYPTVPRPALQRTRHRRRRRPVRVAAVALVGGVAAGLLGVGTAGFAGVLPEPTQDRFEHVVEAVTPYEFTTPAGEGGEPGDACEPELSLCGAEVAEDARDGGVDGDEISERARQQVTQRPPDGLPTVAPTPPGPPPGVPAPADPDPPAPAGPGPGDKPAPPGNDHRPTAPAGR